MCKEEECTRVFQCGRKQVQNTSISKQSVQHYGQQGIPRINPKKQSLDGGINQDDFMVLLRHTKLCSNQTYQW